MKPSALFPGREGFPANRVSLLPPLSPFLLPFIAWLVLALEAQPASRLTVHPESGLVGEDDPRGLRIHIRREGDLHTEVSVEFATVEGHPLPEDDYLPKVEQILFKPGETNHVVVIDLINDSEIEGNECINYTLRNPSAGVVIPEKYPSVCIMDNDLAIPLGRLFEEHFSSIQLEESSAFLFIREDSGRARILVRREGDVETDTAVGYRTMRCTTFCIPDELPDALGDEDYLTTTGLLHFAPGERLKAIEIPILNDLYPELDEVFCLSIDYSPCVALTIIDNDSLLGAQFEFGNYSVARDQDAVILQVFRNNDRDLSAFNLTVATLDGTAIAGRDYRTLTQSLSFAEGELVKTVTVPLIKTEQAELDKRFFVRLGQTAEFPRLGTNSVAEVLISGPVNPIIRRVVESMNTPNLLTTMKQITGEEPVLLGTDVKAIANRFASSLGQLPIALRFAAEMLESLGLDVEFQDWWWRDPDSGAYFANRNVIATKPGRQRAGEVVVFGAHYDAADGPGANDNGTGSAAVILAARALMPYQFERTLQFVLFTGEEQGFLGSAYYVTNLPPPFTNIVAALILDMLGNPVENPGHVKLMTGGISPWDPVLPIVRSFTNVLQGYTKSIEVPLSFLLDIAGVGTSDQISFGRQGFPAVWFYDGGGSPIHSPKDTVASLDMEYLTANVRAIAGTAAHLARPVGYQQTSILEVANSNWIPGSALRAGRLWLKLAPGASGLLDPADKPLPAVNLQNWGLAVYTEPYGTPLEWDSRPPDSDSMYRLKLAVAGSPNLGFSSGSRLRFTFHTPPEPERLYLARVRLEGRYTASGQDYEQIADLRDVVAAGGFLEIPSLRNVPGGTVYGSCEVSSRLRDERPEGCLLRLVSVGPDSASLATSAQPGTRIIDVLEVATRLAPDAAWTAVKSYTNTVRADVASFESGWTEVVHDFGRSRLPPAEEHFFRVRRNWLPR